MVIIARAVPRSELLQNQEATDALELEWVKLETAKWSSKGNQTMDRTGVWGLESVMDYDDAVQAAYDANEVWHFGRLHGFCFEKNAELDKNEPTRKFKGRVVFLGNQVKNQNFEVAVFSDMASRPATLEASAAADFLGLAPGNDVEVADAVQAYVQAMLQGVPTYIELPKHR